MTGEIEQFWVVMCKGGHVLYAADGPFNNIEGAENALDDRDPPGTTCHLKIVKSKIQVEEV